MVGCHKGEDFGQALHASLAYRLPGALLVLDLEEPPNGAYLTVSGFAEIAQYTTVVCLFNDLVWRFDPDRWPCNDPCGRGSLQNTSDMRKGGE